MVATELQETTLERPLSSRSNSTMCSVEAQDRVFLKLDNCKKQTIESFLRGESLLEMMTLDTVLSLEQVSTLSYRSNSTVSSLEAEKRVFQTSKVQDFSSSNDLINNHANIIFNACSDVNVGDQITNVYKSYFLRVKLQIELFK